MDSLHKGGIKTLLHSSDTVSRSAVFCAIATTIERCKTEGVVDVFQVVKAMRMHKPGAVHTVVSPFNRHHNPLASLLNILEYFNDVWGVIVSCLSLLGTIYLNIQSCFGVLGLL